MDVNRLIYETYMGMGPKTVPHWEHWSNPDAETHLTGVDYYEHPRLCRLKMNELYPELRLHVPSSDEPIRRLASLKPAAADLVIMWDNAYCIHELDSEFVPFQDILTLCREAGNPDMVFEFASTSKVTFPGGGISVMAASEANLKYMVSLIGIQTISYDKVNQWRHVQYLKNKSNTLALMKKHAEILRPRFLCVLDTLKAEIEPLGIAHWQTPKGGYFVSVNTLPGLAKRTLALCKEAGVVMTAAGATFPYGKDPQDSNIRIAPSLPPVEELQAAMDIFCVSLRLAALEALA